MRRADKYDPTFFFKIAAIKCNFLSHQSVTTKTHHVTSDKKKKIILIK